MAFPPERACTATDGRSTRRGQTWQSSRDSGGQRWLPEQTRGEKPLRLRRATVGHATGLERRGPPADLDERLSRSAEQPRRPRLYVYV